VAPIWALFLAPFSALFAKQGFTPLYWASEHGHKNVVELLIAEGADVNAVNGGRFMEQTALHIAVSYGHDDIVEILLANGADVNARTYSGKTALEMAAKKGHVKIAELLREHGAVMLRERRRYVSPQNLTE